MALPTRQKQRIWLIIAFIVLGYAASKYDPNASVANGLYLKAYEQQQSDIQIEVEATVKRLLPDDNHGRRHQRFIIELSTGHTILVAHNIDLAPRVDDLNVGDTITVYGEYEWNAKGGVLHWTHHDPENAHPTGWIRHNGNQYQ